MMWEVVQFKCMLHLGNSWVGVLQGTRAVKMYNDVWESAYQGLDLS